MLWVGLHLAKPHRDQMGQAVLADAGWDQGKFTAGDGTGKKGRWSRKAL